MELGSGSFGSFSIDSVSGLIKQNMKLRSKKPNYSNEDKILYNLVYCVEYQICIKLPYYN
jgi:hypothetical protein